MYKASRVATLARLPLRLLQAFRQVVQLRGGLVPALRAIGLIARRQGLSGLRGYVSRAASAGDYDRWTARYDTLDAPALELLASRVGSLRERPLISVVVPTFNTPERYLREMIDSVLAQVYPHWELCIADDASSARHVLEIVTEYARRDSRIKVVARAENGHICIASNDAVAIASGRFLALLDHDDVLPAHALYMIALYAEKNPHAKMFFSDEDKLSPDGNRVQPYFKSDWNATLMLGQNMFSHFGVFDAAFLREVGGFRPGFEGSQDHDVALRCAERLSKDDIVHIPHVLYHWRVIAGSTARDVSAKPYARDASLRSVREHIERMGYAAKVEPLSPDSSMLKVIFAVPEPKPLVSIIIPTRDKAELLARCVDSVLERTLYLNYEILIVDNGSTEADALELLARYAKLPNVGVLPIDAPFNFSALNNLAVEQAKGSMLCLLNNDIEVISTDWLDTLCGYAALPDVGAAGAALWYPGDRLQHGGVLLGIGHLAGHYHHLLPRGDGGYFGRAVLAQDVSAVSAACLVVKKSLYEKVGGLDAEHLQVAFNDVDFCLKLRAAGLRNVYVPYAELYHYESATRSSDTAPDNAARFGREIECMRERWKGAVESDPYYNPNLALSGAAAFSLSFPPRIGQFD